MDGENEINNFVQVWVLAITCLSYCYYIASRIPAGFSRLLSLLPIIYVFSILPLKLTTIHLGGFTAFLLVWLANFKLLLYAFDQGPLSPPPPKLFHFISIACLPIKIKQEPPANCIDEPFKTQSHQIKKQKPEKSCPNPPIPRSILLPIKLVLLFMIFHAYTYKQYLHENVLLVLYCCHTYLQLEITLAVCAAPARAIFGFELEPQFNEPYLATSLQDFWGRRWNLMVTSILRPTVYNPIRNIFTRIIGRTWAQIPAVIAAFAVSGLMHEIIYYYLTCAPPTWEVTSFFVLHGMCLIVEVALKTALTDRWQLHPAVSRPLVVVFVAFTSFGSFWPPLLRNGADERVINELFSFANVAKNKLFSNFQSTKIILSGDRIES
ncbi:acyl-CoA--sterol O-acyltransferase 1-like [Melia azedarach]|uniref:Acyl-CoA--sterol O-acyltransferase 1-like n=1 Tax=Melia azedarach TaxID=155640 RepID=A0ACC1YNT7_MELAZ|nr:acyl-CoA--sterol O-acyltransferase 1-like [Melia azedarach]